MVMGENISFEKLTDGEVVALETIEVTSIPHVSTIAEEHETTAEIVSRYQQEFYGLLKQQGFVIYPGKVSDADTFRIGTIGDVFPEDFERLTQAVAAIRQVN